MFDYDGEAEGDVVRGSVSDDLQGKPQRRRHAKRTQAAKSPPSVVRCQLPVSSRALSV
jgi:hypothetical protein